MRTIDVTGGTVMLDDEDVDLMDQTWHVNNTGAVVRIIRTTDGSSRRIGLTLSRLIMARILGRDLEPRERVIARNGDLTDCRRGNLDITTQRLLQSRYRISRGVRDQA